MSDNIIQPNLMTPDHPHPMGGLGEGPKIDLPDISELHPQVDIPDISKLYPQVELPNISELYPKNELPDFPEIHTKIGLDCPKDISLIAHHPVVDNMHVNHHVHMPVFHH